MFSQQFLSVLGASIRAPNQILSPADKNFYVSFNDTDTRIYGDVTTALVIGQMEHFLILNGDHRNAYAELADRDADLDAYIEYFKRSCSQLNKLSDAPPAATFH